MQKLARALFALCVACVMPTSAVAAVIAQAGTVPFPLDQTSTTDNVQMLLGSLAEHPSDMSVANAGGDLRKNFYLQGLNATSDYAAWTVSVPVGADYQVTLLMQSPQSEQFTVTVVNTVAPVTTPPTALATTTTATFTADNGSWNRYVATVNLPSGTDKITLTRAGTKSGGVNIKSMELLRSSDVDAYNQRVVAARGDTTWLSQAKYGLFYQYGAWGAPNSAADPKSLNQQAADFDVPSFVKAVKASGASYVMWSISWWTYHMDANLTSPNSIVTASGGPANPGLASTRDLIGEIASALHAQGIHFMLYYHTGDEDQAWWPYQDFPTSTWSQTGTGDRSTFLAGVLTLIGFM